VYFSALSLKILICGKIRISLSGVVIKPANSYNRRLKIAHKPKKTLVLKIGVM